MDTTFASSNRLSPLTPRILGVALSVAVGAWLAVFAASMASAQTAQQTSARVAFADLDLNTPAGSHTLLIRITSAARSACGEENHSPLFPRAIAQHRACVNDAVNSAVRQIDAPLVAALYDQTQASISLAAR